MKHLLFNRKYRIPSTRLQNWNYANEAMYFITICTKQKINFFGEIVDGEDSVALSPTEIGKIAYLEWYKTVELRPDMNLELGEFVVMPNHIHGIIIIGANEYNSGRDAMHRVSAPTDDLGNERRDAMHRVSAPTDDFGNERRDAMHRVSTPTDDLGNEPGDAMHRVSTPTNDLGNEPGDAMHRVSTPTNDLDNEPGDAMHRVSTPTDDFGNEPRDAMHRVSTFAPQSKNLASIIRGYKSAVTAYARKNNIDFDWQPRFHDHIIRSMESYHRISNYIIENPAKWYADKFFQP